MACGPRLSVNSADPTATTRLVGQFWGMIPTESLKFSSDRHVFSQKVDVLPGGRRTMGHRL
jgi:hypothetical protein